MAKQTKITKSARGEDCTFRLPLICNFNSETTVLCHLGKSGAGMKSDDAHAAFGCSDCHDVIDARNHTHGLSEAYINQAKLDAMVETQLILMSKGLLVVT
jgi:hypothetical protein